MKSTYKRKKCVIERKEVYVWSGLLFHNAIVKAESSYYGDQPKSSKD